MKALLVIITLATAFAGALAQGKINIGTFNFAPVTNLVTMQLVPAGPDWWAQLYYGADGVTDDAQMISVTNAPVHLAIPGYIVDGVPRYTDATIVDGGEFGTFQVRVWEAALGNTWDTAYVNWLSGNPSFLGRALGKSNLARLVPCPAFAVPGCTPATLNGTTGGQIPVRPFYVDVPEPGVLTLGLAGAIVLRLRRWRRTAVLSVRDFGDQIGRT